MPLRVRDSGLPNRQALVGSGMILAFSRLGWSGLGYPRAVVRITPEPSLCPRHASRLGTDTPYRALLGGSPNPHLPAPSPQLLPHRPIHGDRLHTAAAHVDESAMIGDRPVPEQSRQQR